MKEFEIQIKETLVMNVTVEAENAVQARELVERKWKDGDYVLDSNHFKNVSFANPKKERSYER